MREGSHWRTASLVAGALVIGSLAGPPLARAVAAGLVRIEGAHSTNVAAVSKSGRLLVNAGLATTAAGQLTTAPASPADAVAVIATQGCAHGYVPPKGKALIITSIAFHTFANTAGNPHLLEFLTGTAASPCLNIVASALATETAVTEYQVFSPGIPIPAGDSFGVMGSNDGGTANVYGYLVPAAAVPASAVPHVPGAARGGPLTVRPPH
jgi:hypothetical protein